MDVSCTEKVIKLITKEKEEVLFPAKLVKHSKLLETLTGGVDVDESDTCFDDMEPIPVFSVATDTLKNIISFLEMCDKQQLKPIPKPLPSNILKDVVKPPVFGDWINGFDTDQTANLVLAAHYMDIHSLLQLSCAHMATFIKGKTVEEIRESFGLPAQKI